ncbi:hypothetical protein [Kitasatospora sp. CB02891]|uniref:hypothetical protein n=1 Tax=Kitasatospora sp. CB02891 TaxID=2020329 RepID=UPI000C26FF86|nr:hypothetical protein [Kitasatospora sp. CB02891]PJN24070.1 hypothetical protein CG736_19435 [Kitasatospora sp. CB02891]
MTTRNDQLPRSLGDIVGQLTALQRQIDELRAQQPDMSAADAVLPPLDADTSRWPQTTAGGYTAIARCSSIRHGSALRLVLDTAATSGSTGSVRVIVAGTQWGPTVAAGAQFDWTAPLPAQVAAAGRYDLTVEAQRTSGTGIVAAQTRLIRNIP